MSDPWRQGGESAEAFERTYTTLPAAMAIGGVEDPETDEVRVAVADTSAAVWRSTADRFEREPQ